VYGHWSLLDISQEWEIHEDCRQPQEMFRQDYCKNIGKMALVFSVYSFFANLYKYMEF
jgi:hypothetical protein